MAHPAFERTDHRPWRCPETRWTWRQSWCDLLFAHWPLPASELRAHVPDTLELETFDGSCWVGVVPFRMQGVMRRPLPDLPWISAFPELNVRTYVSVDGKPGVWFFSLDATNPLAIWAARRYFHLPYYPADMSVTRDAGGTIRYRSRRLNAEARFSAEYAPTDDVFEASPGSLDHFLTERYCLYAQDEFGNLYRNEVHHRPWPLQHASARIVHNTVLAPLGLELPDTAPALHFARQIDVVVWNAELVGGA